MGIIGFLVFGLIVGALGATIGEQCTELDVFS